MTRSTHICFSYSEKVMEFLIFWAIFTFSYHKNYFCYFFSFQELFDFTINNDGISDHNAIRTICEQVIRYSVKTNHIQFHNQLYAGMDPFALAGTWISEALNTSQYTYEVGPIFTLMENEIIKMFGDLFGYSDGDGIFSPGGSLSNL